MSNSSDLTKLCVGLNAYMVHAESNNFSTKQTMHGLSGCLVALAPVIALDSLDYDGRSVIIEVLNKLSSTLKESVSVDKLVDLPVVDGPIQIVMAQPEENLDQSIDSDDDWDNISGVINNHNPESIKSRNVFPSASTETDPAAPASSSQ